MLAALQLCAAGKLRCSQKTHRPSAATVVAVAEILQDGDFYPADPIAAFAWPLLLQAGGLAELASGKMGLTARGRAALTKPPHDTLRLLWQRWLNRAWMSSPVSRRSRANARRRCCPPRGPAAMGSPLRERS